MAAVYRHFCCEDTSLPSSLSLSLFLSRYNVKIFMVANNAVTVKLVQTQTWNSNDYTKCSSRFIQIFHAIISDVQVENGGYLSQ